MTQQDIDKALSVIEANLEDLDEAQRDELERLSRSWREIHENARIVVVGDEVEDEPGMVLCTPHHEEIENVHLKPQTREWRASKIIVDGAELEVVEGTLDMNRCKKVTAVKSPDEGIRVNIQR